MASLNKVLLIGNLTRDPETRYTPSGAGVCNLGLAVNRRFTSASGEQREEVCFVDVEVWGKQAESCQTYLHKGSPALVEGRLRYHDWDDRETGRKRSRLTVTAERVQFLGAPSRGSEYGDQQGGYAQSPPAQQRPGPPSSPPPSRPAPPQAAPPPFPAGPQDQSAPPPTDDDDGGQSIDDIPF